MVAGWNAVAEADGLEAALAANAVPGRAENEAAYLKSDLRFLGVTVPAMRSVITTYCRSHRELTHDQVIDLVAALWAEPVHERRSSAVEILRFFQQQLVASDLTFIETLLRDSRTWALVDELAARIVGDLVVAHPELNETLDRWSVDPDFWIRRSALLALLGPLRAGGGAWPRFTRYADAMLDEREFFIRKAIGWILRETAKRRPDLVFEWALPRLGRMSGVTYRELIKPLSAEQQDVLRVRWLQRGS